MSISEVIGERIRSLRKEKKMSQEELAHLASLSNTYIGQVERGEKNITVESLSNIATALKVPLEDLFRYSETKSVNNEVLLKIVDKLHDRSLVEQEEVLKVIDIILGLVDSK
ncbi:helix-turn-helix domain-containing protein [Ureibacillus chungkukjangi]|uniref:helix-turn-helix domain-containing protein n=1 Tax=Ureibacillus chungkukjangi TaxID=1202712 RepID=UPI0038509244